MVVGAEVKVFEKVVVKTCPFCNTDGFGHELDCMLGRRRVDAPVRRRSVVGGSGRRALASEAAAATDDVDGVEPSFLVNEVFFSLQGEGMQSGLPYVFVRFTGCNLACRVSSAGFDCDTEFESGRRLGLSELLAEIKRESQGLAEWVCFTGGEPGLQLSRGLIDGVHSLGLRVAVETNGTVELPDGIDWLCVSPKTAEHTIVVKLADEVKYVRRHGQELPIPRCKSEHRLISPAFGPCGVVQRDLDWCVDLVKRSRGWRLTAQAHKLWGVR